MTYQVLARKWRPRNFSELIGQEHVLRALINALDNQRLHHAFLFSGTRGVGKTTIARILAKSLNCDAGVTSKPCGTCSACREIDEGRFVDLIEVDAASRTKVEDTRELLENVQYTPTRGRYKVYLIDEVHMLSNNSFNALLKTLEEPPPHVKFLLATTDPQRLPVTILSRCLQFNLKRLPPDRIHGYLAYILGEEKIPADNAAIALIARAADGSMRDGLSLLDQAIAYGGGSLAAADVKAMLGTIDDTCIVDMLEALAAGDAERVLQSAADLAEQAPDFGGVLAELLSLLHRIALAQVVPAAAGADGEDPETPARLAALLSPEDVQLYYQIAAIGRRDLPLAPDPRSGFEMVLLRMLAFRPEMAGRTEEPRDGNGRATAAGSPAVVPAQSAAPAGVAPQAVAEPPAPLTAGDEWEDLIGRLGIEGLVRELAVNCTLKERSERAIHLVLDAAHVHLHSDRLVQRLEQALRRQIATDIALRVEIGDHRAHTPEQLAAQRARERQQNAEQAIASDANVRALQEAFGARVIPDSIAPVE